MARRSRRNSAGTRRLAGCATFLMFGIMASLGGLFVYVIGIQPRLLARDAMTWKETPCVIRDVGVETHTGSRNGRKGSTSFSPKVTFEYSVAGQSYSSQRFWFGNTLASNRQVVVDKLAPYAVGGEAVCYVNPENPSDAVLVREASFQSDLGWLVGGIFALVGLVGCLGSLWSMVRGTTSEGSSTTTSASATRLPASVQNLLMENSASDRPKYHIDLEACPLESDAPDEPMVLKQSVSRLMAAVMVWIVAIVFNAIIGTIFYAVIYNKAGVVAYIFLSIFALIGLLILWGALYKTLQLGNPVTTLVCSQRNLYPGSEFEVSWLHQGQVSRIKDFKIILEGEEISSFRQGTSTRTERNRFYESVLVNTQDQAAIQQGFALVKFADDTMHSFKSAHNQILWQIRVRGVIDFWPDIDDAYEIKIYPPLPA